MSQKKAQKKKPEYNKADLQQKFILGNYKSVKNFCDKEGLNYPYVRQLLAGIKKEKLTKDLQKTNKIIEKTNKKTIEKVSEKLSNKILDCIETANDLHAVIKTALKEKQYNNYITKATTYSDEGKPNGQELTTQNLKIADTRALLNLASVIEKIDKIINKPEQSQDDKSTTRDSFLKHLEGLNNAD